jgi:FtsP/CotA-like multicopper oxidase with cupredoxin domain
MFLAYQQRLRREVSRRLRSPNQARRTTPCVSAQVRIEIAPKRIVSAITYTGQFPGPLLRFKEGQPVTVEVHNDTEFHSLTLNKPIVTERIVSSAFRRNVSEP